MKLINNVVRNKLVEEHSQKKSTVEMRAMEILQIDDSKYRTQNNGFAEHRKVKSTLENYKTEDKSK